MTPDPLAALSRIEAWTRNVKGLTSPGVTRTLGLVHDEAERAIAAGVTLSPAPTDTLREAAVAAVETHLLRIVNRTRPMDQAEGLAILAALRAALDTLRDVIPACDFPCDRCHSTPASPTDTLHLTDKLDAAYARIEWLEALVKGYQSTPTDTLREAAHLVIDDTPLHLVCGVCGNREEDDFHEMTDWGHDFIPAARPPGACDQPPEGWYCTRTKGHDGPCAALRAALDTTKEADHGSEA